MRMSSFYSVLQYRGTNFAGWQIQPDQKTVQGAVEHALTRLADMPVRVVAAGRTDTGVHALGQTISFRMPETWNARDLQRAMNSLLPPDIWVARAGTAPDDFNARKHAASRSYLYIIGCDAASNSPFRYDSEWALARWPSLELMRGGAELFAGKHDFTAFAAVGQEKEHYRCIVSSSMLVERDDAKGVIFNIVADRFLHHMVRFIVGTLVDVGLKKRPLSDIARLLESTDNSETSPPAPPQGLYLVEVKYPQLEET